LTSNKKLGTDAEHRTPCERTANANIVAAPFVPNIGATAFEPITFKTDEYIVGHTCLVCCENSRSTFLNMKLRQFQVSFSFVTGSDLE
jgi:hypothetical protein